MKTKETFYKEIENRTNTFFNSLLSECDIAINDYIYIDDIFDIDNIENFDSAEVFDKITSILEDNDAFNLEITYYSNAIDYLKENDPSLNESLVIAAEYGLEIQSLNSEVLASLLYSQVETENYSRLESDITTFFEEIEQEINAFFDNQFNN